MVDSAHVETCFMLPILEQGQLELRQGTEPKRRIAYTLFMDALKHFMSDAMMYIIGLQRIATITASSEESSLDGMKHLIRGAAEQ